jgi:hypothetical protein
VPTAISAVRVQPHTRPATRHRLGLGRRPRPGRRFAFALAIPLAISFLAAEPLSAAANAGPSCSSWNSLTRPPDTIRVLRRKSGQIITVSFRKYVVTVMGKEWPSYLPQPVVEAGAIAVKQYAWYHTVYTSRASNGRCFDVKDGTGDQLYRPNKSRVRPDHYAALDATWNVSLRKDGRFFMTGYRRGDRVRCGRDATGYKLFARSATMCARRGYNWQQILKMYYGPGLEFVNSGSGANDSATPDSSAESNPDTAAQPSATVTQPAPTVAGSQAVRLPDGRWIDAPLDHDALVITAFGGGTTGGITAAAEDLIVF